jgi:hypothetical protein
MVMVYTNFSILFLQKNPPFVVFFKKNLTIFRYDHFLWIIQRKSMP